MEIIVSYWREILVATGYLISLVCSIILLIKKNKGFDVYTKALNEILAKVPAYISLVEGSGLTGPEKKFKVIEACLKDLSSIFGRALSTDESNYLKGILDTFIELVLSTPQKK